MGHVTEEQSTLAVNSANLASTHSTKDDVEKTTNPGTADEKSTDTAESKIVDWDGPNDPANPLNWTPLRKWSIISLVSYITFVTYVSLLGPILVSRICSQ
jgi:hypothetical protein